MKNNKIQFKTIVHNNYKYKNTNKKDYTVCDQILCILLYVYNTIKAFVIIPTLVKTSRALSKYAD